MVFKEVIEKEILFNEYFFGEMMTSENNDQNKKFFTQNNEAINIPTLTIYPPKISEVLHISIASIMIILLKRVQVEVLFPEPTNGLCI